MPLAVAPVSPTNSIQGPGLFLAQFLGEKPPFNTLDALAEWTSGLGYNGVQVLTWDVRAIDLDVVATSAGYCDDYKGRLADVGLAVIELASCPQGEVTAMQPAYKRLFQSFSSPAIRWSSMEDGPTPAVSGSSSPSVRTSASGTATEG